MKASRLIRNLLLAGTVSLTLTSCGGGDGSSSDNSEITPPGNTPSTPEVLFAPESLSEGMVFRLSVDGASGPREDYTITISSGSYCCESEAGSCNYTYNKTGERTATLKIQYSGYEETYALTFTDATSGQGTWSYLVDGKMEKYTVTFTLDNREDSNNNGSASEDNANNSTDDSSTDNNTQLAPDSLTVGKVVNLHANDGSISSYTLNSSTSCTSHSGTKLTWVYTVTRDTTAEWVTSNALNIPTTTKMVFTSATGGTYTRLNASNSVIASGSFNLSDKVDAPVQDDENINHNDETVEDREENNAEETAPESIALQKWFISEGRGNQSTYLV